jgi:hypothetical protein
MCAALAGNPNHCPVPVPRQLTFAAAVALLPVPAAGLDASLELKKSMHLDLPAAALSNSGPVIMHMAANPSAPATAAAAEPQVLLSLPRLSVDLGISKQKVPLLSVADAPCKKLCKDKCEIKMEKTCINVTLPKKDCKLGSKTITKQFCEKRCKPSLELQLPSFKLPKLPTTVPAANSNPSTPPAAANPSAPPATLQAAADTDADANAGASAGGLLSGVVGLLSDKLPKADLDVDCRNVCVDVPIVLPELECVESSKVVEKCTVVPEKSCKEECVCLPQKSLSLSLPKKPALSVSASLDKLSA